jgi:putative membrane protein
MEPVTANSNSDSVSVELSSRRTGMSFQRTRMSADRTLMSVIRTALSLISFGFTIYQVFEKLRDAGTIAHDAAPRNFGVALVLIGIGMLIVGIVYHLQFMSHLRLTRDEMTASGLIHGQSGFPVSFTLVIALLLLILGFVAVISMVFDIALLG